MPSLDPPDPAARPGDRPLCRVCGQRPAARVYGRRRRWGARCAKCARPGRLNSYEERRRKQRAAWVVGRPCAACGFVPAHPCQMDLDHRDGNHRNNDPANLQVLCACCHRLKTLRHRDTARVHQPPIPPGTPLCIRCGVRPAERYVNSSTKRPGYLRHCRACRKGTTQDGASYRQRRRQRAWLHVMHPCPRCGFAPEHPCQMDIDHIDGNHRNNDPANLQVLCANCHRLKTQKQQDWRSPSGGPDGSPR